MIQNIQIEFKYNIQIECSYRKLNSQIIVMKLQAKLSSYTTSKNFFFFASAVMVNLIGQLA